MAKSLSDSLDAYSWNVCHQLVETGGRVAQSPAARARPGDAFRLRNLYCGAATAERGHRVRERRPRSNKGAGAWLGHGPRAPVSWMSYGPESGEKRVIEEAPEDRRLEARSRAPDIGRQSRPSAKQLPG